MRKGTINIKEIQSVRPNFQIHENSDALRICKGGVWLWGNISKNVLF